MRVLMTGDTVGGVWTYALTLARQLCSQGIEVHLATMGRLPDAGQRAQAQRIDGLVLHASAWRLCWMPDPWRDIDCAADWLQRLAQTLRPELVHLNDFGHADRHWPAPTLLVAHSCVLSWWQAVHGRPAPAGWQRYRGLVQRGLQRADARVAPSVAMATALKAHYGPLPEVRVIANGGDAAGDTHAAKQALILAAGRLWDPAKNLGALAAVAEHLPWQVIIAGDGGEGFADHLPPNLQLSGRLDAAALARCYARAAVFVLPARYEPFGLAALEAAAHGCALVLGDIASLREVWGDAALYVRPDDQAGLRSVLLKLIRHPALCRRYGERAAQRASTYSAAAMGAHYLDAYRQLQQLPSRRSA